jgi:hypothetical protein
LVTLVKREVVVMEGEVLCSPWLRMGLIVFGSCIFGRAICPKGQEKEFEECRGEHAPEIRDNIKRVSREPSIG